MAQMLNVTYGRSKSSTNAMGMREMQARAYIFDSSASVSSSRIAPSATLALNSGEWFSSSSLQIVFLISRSTLNNGLNFRDHLSRMHHWDKTSARILPAIYRKRFGLIRVVLSEESKIII